MLCPQILQLIEDRIVAPETHQHPQGWFTWFLHTTGLAASIPLFHPVTESIYQRSYLGTAASHALAINNWTMELMQLPPSERQERNLLLFEVRSCWVRAKGSGGCATCGLLGHDMRACPAVYVNVHVC